MEKTAFKLFVLFILSVPVLNAQSLWVWGITNPVGANGKYLKQAGTIDGYEYWQHETSTYFIYNKTYSGDSKRYWNIDLDTDDADSYFYSQSILTSPIGLPWSQLGTATGIPHIVVYTSNTEIAILGNTVEITDGDTVPSFRDLTNFGSANVSGETAVRTFTIANAGAAVLALTAGSPFITIGGSNAGDFSITVVPSSSIAPLGSTTFQITFNPSASGKRNAVISIANDDGDENPYEFSIQGRGYVPHNINVAGVTAPAAANGLYIHQGTLNNFEYWKNSSGAYYIYNDEYTGSRYWDIDVDQDDATALFYSDDHFEDAAVTNVLIWHLKDGAGSPVVTDVIASPNIAITGNYQAISNDDWTPSLKDFTDFASADVTGGTVMRTFTIKNRGAAALTVSGSSPYITFSGTHASDFAVTSIARSSVAAGDSLSFQVTFNPSSHGTRSALLSIPSNDPDENPFTFSIQGWGYHPCALTVSGITTPSGANGRYIHQGVSEEFQYWKHESADFYIYNSAYGAQRYWNIDIDLDDASSLFYSDDHQEGVSPTTVAVWHVLDGTGTPAMVFSTPDMNVVGNGISIADGDATSNATDFTDFGAVSVSSGTIIRTFTIQNLGNAALTLSGGSPYVVVGGPQSAEFAVTTLPATSVAAGGATTFQITFNPSGGGTRGATLSIGTNDLDENPYDFGIQGTGLSTITFADGSGYTQAIAPGNANQQLGRFRLTADAAGAALTGAVIQLNGVRNGLSNLKLWGSADAVFGGDTQLGGVVAVDPGNANSVTFSGFSSPIGTGGTYYFLTGDVAPGGTGTVRGTIVQNSSFTVNGGTLAGTISNATLSGGVLPLPVELTSFTASIAQTNVSLAWKTATETNNYGFEIEKRLMSSGVPGRDEWKKIGFVDGNGTSNTAHEYTYADGNLASGTYAYRLKQLDRNGNFVYSCEQSVTIEVPRVFALYQNFPNPFNPTTTITFTLEVDGFTTLAVFDALGKKIATLVDAPMKAGIVHRISFNASNFSSGVYMTRLESGGRSQIKRIVLMK